MILILAMLPSIMLTVMVIYMIVNGWKEHKDYIIATTLWYIIIFGSIGWFVWSIGYLIEHTLKT